MGKFFVRVLGIPCVQPDLTGHHGALSAVFKAFPADDALIDRAGFSLRRVEHSAAAGIAARAHGSVTGTGTAVCAAHAEISAF